MSATDWIAGSVTRLPGGGRRDSFPLRLAASLLGSGLAITLTMAVASAQGLITTIAGTDWLFPALKMPALDAPIGSSSLAVDSVGNLLLGDLSNNMLFKLTPDGMLSVVAGNGIQDSTGDNGPAAKAAINLRQIAADPFGNVFIIGAGRVRKIDASGIIRPFAGNGQTGFSGDNGPALHASFSATSGIASDASGNIYVVDSGNQRVRRVSLNGIITTVAGNGTQGVSGDNGAATSASLNAPSRVAADAQGNLFILDSGNLRIRKVTPQGIISTVTTFEPSAVQGIAVDPLGNLFLDERFPYRIRRLTPSGSFMVVAGNGAQGIVRNGPATESPTTSSGSLAIDRDGNLFMSLFADVGSGGGVARITASGMIAKIVGNGRYRFSGDGLLATNAHINDAWGVATALDGSIYFADRTNKRVRRIDRQGIITTVAGNGGEVDNQNNVPATSVGVGLVECVAISPSGILYLSSPSLGLRRITSDGLIRSVSSISTRSIAFDALGNLLMTVQHQLQRFSPEGVFQALIVGGPAGFAGDGNQAVNASLNLPSGLVVDSLGNVFIADSGNNRVRRVSPQGIITTVAGNGTRGFSGDGGPATIASLALSSPGSLMPPNGLAVDRLGNLYIADSYNSRVRRVTPGGIITTFAGGGTLGGIFTIAGDGGPATDARLAQPAGLAFDFGGSLIITDPGFLENRMRKVLAQPPSFRLTSPALTFTASSRGALAAPQLLGVVTEIDGVRFVVNSGTTNGGSWLSVKPLGSATPRALEVTADPSNLDPGTYQGTIAITAPTATPTTQSVTVTLVVGPSAPPRLEIDLQNVTFTFPRNGRRREQTLTVRNSGSGTLPITLSSATSSGGAWLSVLPTSVQVTATAPAGIRVVADPSGLAPGTYAGSIGVASLGITRTIPVVMTISTVDQAILLSQSGLSFTAVAGGGVVPPQNFAVLNIGNGAVNWRAAASTLSGGSNWLQVSPEGVADASAPRTQTAEVSINASGLQPGRYYGLIRVDAPGAANTPQVLTAFLEVLTSDATPPAVIQPSEISFNASEGTTPGSEDIFIYNLSRSSISFQSNVLFAADASASFQIRKLPAAGTIAPSQPARMVVQPSGIATLSPGLRRVTIPIQFSDGSVREAGVSLLVESAPSGSVSSAKGSRRDAGCVPGRLMPAVLSIGQGGSVPAGWPAAISVRVKDDCGSDLQSGSVVATFSNGDVPVSLVSLKDGRWHGTWQSRASGRADIGVRIQADDPATRLSGVLDVTAELRASIEPPAITTEGIVSAANPVSFVPLAPGGLISIFGLRLTEGLPVQTQSTPLPASLGGTEVVMAGNRLPLFYAGQDQVNAMVPYEIAVDTVHQILVRRGLTYSRPVPVNVAATQPAMFPYSAAGESQALAVVVRSSESTFLNSPTARARSGDTLVIYCTGLGMLDQPLTAGQASPAGSLINARTPVHLRIGGVTAPVLFQGLTPGFVGLYQLNVTVPVGAPSGTKIPIELEAAGQFAPSATLALQ